ncbi:MAG: AAA family ATPase [Acidimicrobiales bacterium]
MRITRLYLRNYRVYEEPLELEIPPGLVGIYGVNGAGKSVLLEAILFTLWGVARTNKDEVRTAGILADCVTEVEFEHEGTLYLVRRTLSGAASTARAEAHANGSQVSEGVKDTARYVHSVLGLDDGAFRASVFAEQKQLAAFSVRSPAERRKLVLGLLGITPLDAARDQARKDTRDARARLDQVRAVLADVGQLEEELAGEREAATCVEAEAGAASALAEVRAEEVAKLQAEHNRLDRLGRSYDSLLADGRARRGERDDLAHRVERLQDEACGLAEAGKRLVGLEDRASGLRRLMGLLFLVDVVVSALDDYRRAVAKVPAEPPALDGDAVRQAVESDQSARAGLAALEGRQASAVADRERAALALSRAGELSGEEDCPLCGQPLGTAFEAVQAHRRAELESAEAALGGLRAGVAAASLEATRASGVARKAQEAFSSAETERAAWERATERQGEALERLVAAVDAAGPAIDAAAPAMDAAAPAMDAAAPAIDAAAPAIAAAVGKGAGREVGRPAEGEAFVAPLALAERLEAGRTQLAGEVDDTRKAADEAGTLRGRLERRAAVDADLEEFGRRLQSLDAELVELRERVKTLDFQPEDLVGAAAALEEARTVAQAAAQAAHAAQLALAGASAKVEAGIRRLSDAREQHRHLAELGDHVRHLGRTAELLGAFRNVVVGSVGPRLSAQANELFAELTDNEYDGLEVDPETYEIKISDHGSTYGMDRFSGSETDLANLALRVAISEQVMLLSGGAVGLLVLDEVFGPLDADRKERMLLALERLKGRFRQVLVVTHDRDLKEQLPNAIEVVKLAGRRATARVL